MKRRGFGDGQAVQNCLHLAAHEDLSAEKRKEYFDMACAELDRLSLTVKNMLDFYRPGATKAERVEVGELLSYVVNLTKKQLSERGIRINLDLPKRLPPVTLVGSQIQQVFINLILNSFDAMQSGGAIDIRGRALRNGVEIFFQDSGPGIPGEMQSDVFEPFYSTKEGGTGLGLTVSYNIVTAHGGTLELIPDRGKGACFRVFLPSGDDT